MLALARENQRKAGATNVEFLKGEIEAIPLPDNSVDVIISNCVINLSADKDRVLREAFRVLKPGGRFAVSDVVVRGAVPEDIRRNVELWIGCVAGALEDTAYRDKLVAAGFCVGRDRAVARVQMSARSESSLMTCRETHSPARSSGRRSRRPAAIRRAARRPSTRSRPWRDSRPSHVGRVWMRAT